jgi:hypothetical protein
MSELSPHSRVTTAAVSSSTKLRSLAFKLYAVICKTFELKLFPHRSILHMKPSSIVVVPRAGGALSRIFTPPHLIVWINPHRTHPTMKQDASNLVAEGKCFIAMVNSFASAPNLLTLLSTLNISSHIHASEHRGVRIPVSAGSPSIFAGYIGISLTRVSCSDLRSLSAPDLSSLATRLGSFPIKCKEREAQEPQSVRLTAYHRTI